MCLRQEEMICTLRLKKTKHLKSLTITLIQHHVNANDTCKEMEKIDDNAASVSTWTTLSPTNKNTNQYFA